MLSQQMSLVLLLVYKKLSLSPVFPFKGLELGLGLGLVLVLHNIF